MTFESIALEKRGRIMPQSSVIFIFSGRGEGSFLIGMKLLVRWMLKGNKIVSDILGVCKVILTVVNISSHFF